MNKTNQKGFTLIELLVVIAIIGLLSTLAVVSLNNAREKSRDSKRVSDVKQLQTALEMYYTECGGYPTGVDGTSRLSPASEYSDGTDSCSVAFGEYMSEIPEPPTPPDGSCVANNNTYYYIPCTADGDDCDDTEDGMRGASYAIEYCLGGTAGNIDPGPHYANPGGLTGDGPGATGFETDDD